MVQSQYQSNVRHIRRKRSAAPVFGLWLFLLFICLLTTYFFIHSAFFSVQNIEVEGNTALQRERIIETSGLNYGTNIFSMDTNEAILKIKMYPSVKEVMIKRKLPNTLQISVDERVPLALVVGQNGFIIVDNEGIFLKKVTDLKDLNMPVISGIPVDDSGRPGSSIMTPSLDAALKVAELMNETLRENVTEIMAPSPLSLTLKTVQGVKVLFGEPNDFERKVKLMEKLLTKNGAVINEQTVEYIDLRYDTSPVIKRKS